MQSLTVGSRNLTTTMPTAAGADLFRMGTNTYISQQAAQMYTQHPQSVRILADIKSRYDARQANSQAPRSLEKFYGQHDLGNGEVRIEDFRAGWSLGGVNLAPMQVATLRGAYGSEDRTIRYGELLADLDSMTTQEATSVVMTTRMGHTSAKYIGYTQDKQGGPTLASTGPLTTGLTGSLRPGTARVSTLMRTSQGQPIVAANSTANTATYNTTAVTNAAVTQRGKSMRPQSAAATMGRINANANSSPTLADNLSNYDPAGTGCVTVDAFLTCCARAGLTLKPDELDALRADGTVRRPYAAAPELVDYASFLTFLTS